VTTVNVAVKGPVEKEPTEDEVALASIGACFDKMSPEDQKVLLERFGSMEAIRKQVMLNDCK